MIKRILAALIFFLLVPSTVSAEMYRYTDDHGNLHFTDDLTQVPESQRTEITSMRSIEGKAEGDAYTESKTPETVSVEEIWEDGLQRQAQDLEKTRAALDKTYESIQNKKAALLQEAPAESASQDEIRRFENKITSLNKEIEAYEAKRRNFEKHMKDFNAGIRH